MLDISARPGWLPTFHTAVSGGRWMDGLALTAAAASVPLLVNFAAYKAVSLFYSTDFSKIQISIL